MCGPTHPVSYVGQHIYVEQRFMYHVDQLDVCQRYSVDQLYVCQRYYVGQLYVCQRYYVGQLPISFSKSRDSPRDASRD